MYTSYWIYNKQIFAFIIKKKIKYESRLTGQLLTSLQRGLLSVNGYTGGHNHVTDYAISCGLFKMICQ